MEKAADCRVLQAELNDLGGLIIKVEGEVAALKAGLAAAKGVIDRFGGECLTHLIASPAEAGWPGIWGPAEYSPLMEANVVYFPRFEPVTNEQRETRRKEMNMNEVTDRAKPQAAGSNAAIGFIETQGYTAVIEAIDTACKAANVEVLGREKLGGGFITVVITGDIAAVEAAVEAGKAKVEGLGKLIAAHIIARPSAGVMGLLPTAPSR
jgi:microcompartment protein CcmL/EutN